MDEQFSVVVGGGLEGEVGQLTDVQILGSGLDLASADQMASEHDGYVVAPGALPE